MSAGKLLVFQVFFYSVLSVYDGQVFAQSCDSESSSWECVLTEFQQFKKQGRLKEFLDRENSFEALEPASKGENKARIGQLILYKFNLKSRPSKEYLLRLALQNNCSILEQKVNFRVPPTLVEARKICEGLQKGMVSSVCPNHARSPEKEACACALGKTIEIKSRSSEVLQAFMEGCNRSAVGLRSDSGCDDKSSPISASANLLVGQATQIAEQGSLPKSNRGKGEKGKESIPTITGPMHYGYSPVEFTRNAKTSDDILTNINYLCKSPHGRAEAGFMRWMKYVTEHFKKQEKESALKTVLENARGFDAAFHGVCSNGEAKRELAEISLNPDLVDPFAQRKLTEPKEKQQAEEYFNFHGEYLRKFKGVQASYPDELLRSATKNNRFLRSNSETPALRFGLTLNMRKRTLKSGEVVEVPQNQGQVAISIAAPAGVIKTKEDLETYYAEARKLVLAPLSEPDGLAAKVHVESDPTTGALRKITPKAYDPAKPSRVFILPGGSNETIHNSSTYLRIVEAVHNGDNVYVHQMNFKGKPRLTRAGVWMARQLEEALPKDVKFDSIYITGHGSPLGIEMNENMPLRSLLGRSQAVAEVFKKRSKPEVSIILDSCATAKKIPFLTPFAQWFSKAVGNQNITTAATKNLPQDGIFSMTDKAGKLRVEFGESGNQRLETITTQFVDGKKMDRTKNRLDPSEVGISK